jgi:transposase
VSERRRQASVRRSGRYLAVESLLNGTHSPWVSRLLRGFDHEVVIANPRQVKLIRASSRKDDRLDAQTLARLARVNPRLLRPIQHRSRKAQQDLMVIRVRAALVEARTGLINTARGLAKSLGERLPVCDTDQMGTEQTESLPVELQRVLEPLMEQVVSLTARVKEMDRKVEQIAREDYPETVLLQQVKGVGPLIALTFVLTLDDKARFQKSRDVGFYVGLRPRRSESGETQPQLRITKEGDAYLRKMWVQGAHYILGHRGQIRPETMGTEACRTRWKAGKEGSSDCSGTKIRHPAAPDVGNRRSLRTLAKRPHATRVEEDSGLIRSGFACCKSSSSGDCGVG